MSKQVNTETYAIAKYQPYGKITDLILATVYDNTNTIKLSRMSIAEIKEKMKVNPNIIENIVYMKKTGVIRGKYFSLNQLINFGGKSNIVIKVDSHIADVIHIEANKAMLNKIPITELTKDTIYSNPMQYTYLGAPIVNITGTEIKCKYIKNEQKQGANQRASKGQGAKHGTNGTIKYLLSTVANPNVVWTMQEFEMYMKYMKYTYKVSSIGTTSTTYGLLDVDEKCKVVHIPIGIVEVQNLFRNEPIHKDTVIIFSSTVSGVRKLCKNRKSDIIEVGSIFFQKGTKTNPTDKSLDIFEGVGLYNLKINGHCNLPDCKLIMNTFNSCEMRIFNIETITSIQSSFNNLINSKIMVKSRGIKHSFCSMFDSEIYLETCRTSLEDAANINDSFNICRDSSIIIEPVFMTHIRESLNKCACTFIKITDNSNIELLRSSVNLGTNITGILDNGKLDLTGINEIYKSCNMEGVKDIYIEDIANGVKTYPIGKDMKGGAGSAVLHIRAYRSNAMGKGFISGDCLTEYNEDFYSDIQWDLNKVYEEYEFNIGLSLSTTLTKCKGYMDIKLPNNVTILNVNNSFDGDIIDTMIVPNAHTISLSILNRQMAHTIILNDNIEHIENDSLFDLEKLGNDKKIGIGKNLVISSVEAEILANAIMEYVVYMTEKNDTYEKLTKKWSNNKNHR